MTRVSKLSLKLRVKLLSMERLSQKYRGKKRSSRKAPKQQLCEDNKKNLRKTNSDSERFKTYIHSLGPSQNQDRDIASLELFQQKTYMRRANTSLTS